MPACPFCKSQVRADLLKYGGHCPKCMIAIPGEETPTDPGERAKVLQELEEQAAKSKHRGAFMAAAAAMGLLLGGGGAYWYQNREEPAPVVTGNIEDEIYIVPLGGLGPNVKKSDIEGIVLSDPVQINTMVKRVLSKGQPQLTHCYESRLKEDAHLKGRWNVQFQIEPTGHASAVTVVAVDAPDSE